MRSKAPDEVRAVSNDVAFEGTLFYCKGNSPGTGPRASVYGLGIQSKYIKSKIISKTAIMARQRTWGSKEKRVRIPMLAKCPYTVST